MPSPAAPLHGSCLCGTVRFRVTGPFWTAGYCHCTRCQRRSGTSSTANAMLAAEDFRLEAGAQAIRTWEPPDGMSKSFCSHCGGHLYSGDPVGTGTVGVRLGALHGDPGIRPRWRQWLDSAVPWEEIPDDGLPRFGGRREIDLG